MIDRGNSSVRVELSDSDAPASRLCSRLSRSHEQQQGVVSRRGAPLVAVAVPPYKHLPSPFPLPLQGQRHSSHLPSQHCHCPVTHSLLSTTEIQPASPPAHLLRALSNSCPTLYAHTIREPCQDKSRTMEDTPLKSRHDLA